MQRPNPYMDENQQRIEQGRAFARAFRQAWYDTLCQNHVYRIVEYDGRDNLCRQVSDQIRNGHNTETDLFLVRRDENSPVGYDRYMFLEIKAGMAGIKYESFFNGVIQPAYDRARNLLGPIFGTIPQINARYNVFDLNGSELKKYIVHQENGIFAGGTPDDYEIVVFHIAVLAYAGFRNIDRGRLFAQWVQDIHIWAPYCPIGKDAQNPENWIANVNLADFQSLAQILCQGLGMELELAQQVERRTLENALANPRLNPNVR